MNIDELIKNRRATPPRFISGEKVEKEKIQRLLENANWAPSHRNGTGSFLGIATVFAVNS